MFCSASSMLLLKAYQTNTLHNIPYTYLKLSKMSEWSAAFFYQLLGFFEKIIITWSAFSSFPGLTRRLSLLEFRYSSVLILTSTPWDLERGFFTSSLTSSPWPPDQVTKATCHMCCQMCMSLLSKITDQMIQLKWTTQAVWNAYPWCW